MVYQHTGSIVGTLVTFGAAVVTLWLGSMNVVQLLLSRRGEIGAAYGPHAASALKLLEQLGTQPTSIAIGSVVFGEYLIRTLFHLLVASLNWLTPSEHSPKPPNAGPPNLRIDWLTVDQPGRTQPQIGPPYVQGMEGVPPWGIRLAACAAVLLIETFALVGTRQANQPRSTHSTTSATTTIDARQHLHTRRTISRSLRRLARQASFTLILSIPLLAAIGSHLGHANERSRRTFTFNENLIVGYSTEPRAYAVAFLGANFALLAQLRVAKKVADRKVSFVLLIRAVAQRCLNADIESLP